MPGVARRTAEGGCAHILSLHSHANAVVHQGNVPY